jgi:hypothetical protein
VDLSLVEYKGLLGKSRMINIFHQLNLLRGGFFSSSSPFTIKQSGEIFVQNETGSSFDVSPTCSVTITRGDLMSLNFSRLFLCSNFMIFVLPDVLLQFFRKDLVMIAVYMLAVLRSCLI